MYDNETPHRVDPTTVRGPDDTAVMPTAAHAARAAVGAPLIDPSPEAPQARTPSPGVVTVSPPPSPIVVKQGARWWQIVVAAVLGAVLAVGGLQLIEGDTAATTTSPTVAIPAADMASGDVVDVDAPVADVPAPDQPASVTDAVAVGEAVIPSIVTVEVVVRGTVAGSGSGVIVSDDGYIVTNNHVVEVGSTFQVVLSDGRTTYQARLVGTDPLTDLAVLDIEATGLTPIEFGAAATLSVGDAAVAVGSPLGLEGGPSLTVGVVSAFGRQVQTSATEVLYGMIQTDAPITSGSSGGALVDGAGQLIGITTAVGVSSVGVEGIGFATPVEIVSRVVDELISDGQVNHAFLGITGGTAFESASDGARIASGVEIASVEPGSAAAAAGLRAGDVITSIDGVAVETMDELIVSLRVRFPNDQIELTVNGAASMVTLGAR